jgi:hypothetical protein
MPANWSSICGRARLEDCRPAGTIGLARGFLSRSVTLQDDPGERSSEEAFMTFVNRLKMAATAAVLVGVFGSPALAQSAKAAL